MIRSSPPWILASCRRSLPRTSRDCTPTTNMARHSVAARLDLCDQGRVHRLRCICAWKDTSSPDRQGCPSQWWLQSPLAPLRQASLGSAPPADDSRPVQLGSEGHLKSSWPCHRNHQQDVPHNVQLQERAQRQEFLAGAPHSTWVTSRVRKPFSTDLPANSQRKRHPMDRYRC